MITPRRLVSLAAIACFSTVLMSLSFATVEVDCHMHIKSIPGGLTPICVWNCPTGANCDVLETAPGSDKWKCYCGANEVVGEECDATWHTGNPGAYVKCDNPPGTCTAPNKCYKFNQIGWIPEPGDPNGVDACSCQQ